MERRPPWLRKPLVFDAERSTALLLKDLNVNTVCREARCPNISECFHNRHATFLILGAACTRRCAFCHVTKGTPLPLDPTEPERVAEAAHRLDLRHIIITSVTRDDLADGGAAVFAQTVRAARHRVPGATLELLIPDLNGNETALTTILESGPDILGHNVETVPRLYAHRPRASYERSLKILAASKKITPDIATKSSLMLGLGETKEEVLRVMKELRDNACDLLALGQYLRPDLEQTEVVRYVAPDEFASFREEGLKLGFLQVESGPYVRSSYRTAHDQQPMAAPKS
jgi:lipoic acid synthetase